jgi:hypothetical protein
MAYLNCKKAAKTTKLDPKLEERKQRSENTKFQQKFKIEGEKPPPLNEKQNMHLDLPLPPQKFKINIALTGGHTKI